MADDISKKILIQVEADTNQLKQNVADLNSTLDGLIQKQKQLSDTGQQSTKAFQDMAEQVKAAQSAIESYSKAQESGLSKSKVAFDAHKATIDALKSSFDKIKGVSGEFGPSLEQAAKGFDALKSGLDVVKTGFNSVGDAIKTTGFGLLVLVLQSVVEYFTKTKDGSAKLKGAISAVGVVVEKINNAFASLGRFIVDAVSHPIESIKALGNMIKENIINRFNAFGVILDGIVHLYFKKMANGAIQAFTGVTDVTDKAVHLFKTAKKGAEEVGQEMVNAYVKGAKGAGKAVDDHESKVIASLNKQIAKYKELLQAARRAHGEQNKKDKPVQRGEQLDNGNQEGVTISPSTADPNVAASMKATLKTVQDTADKTVAIKKTAQQQIEDYAKQSAGKIATDALNVLTTSIKQQADAKIAGLEKDKAGELSNSSLTSSQKLAIQQKYKQQEGAIKAKAFKEEQEASIAQAIINGALAITKVSSQSGVLAPLEIGVTIAETAAQVAKIAAQKAPAYAQGGLHYNSDGRGGVLPGYSRTDNTNAFLRSGEGVVVSEAMRVPWARNLVSAINVGFGGRDFAVTNPGRGYAVGGIFTDGGDANRYYNQPANDQKNLANTIAYQMINNFPPVYVDVKDVNNQQNILAQTINRVNL